MKNLVVLLIILLVFCVCATLGYNLATNIDQLTVEKPQPTTDVILSSTSEQHNFIIVMVDQLDAKKPQLISAWYVSVFFLEGKPPILTFAQLYAPWSTTESAKKLERSFSMSGSKEPGSRFWKAVQAVNVQWEGYFVVDALSTQRLLEWGNGPGDFLSPFGYPDRTRQLIQQTCQSLETISTRNAAPFDWNGLVPEHFHSDMHMEKTLSYWNRVITAGQPPRCEIILAP